MSSVDSRVPERNAPSKTESAPRRPATEQLIVTAGGTAGHSGAMKKGPGGTAPGPDLFMDAWAGSEPKSALVSPILRCSGLADLLPEKANLGAAGKNPFQVSDSPLSARLLDDAPLMGANNPKEDPMSTPKYLCMYRGASSQNKPSPAQMQEMFAAFNQWKEKFKANILDMGSKQIGRASCRERV